MSIDSFDSLKQSVINYSKRRDASDLMDNFIDLCEQNIDKKLHLIANEKIINATLSTNDRYITVPSDLLRIKKLSIIYGGGPIMLDYRSPANLQISNHAHTPRFYTRSGNKIELECSPDANYVLEMVYQARIQSLSEDNTTNNVLAQYPGIYLYGTLAEVYTWARDEQTAQYYEGKFQSLIDAANAEENKNRIGGSPVARADGIIP